MAKDVVYQKVTQKLFFGDLTCPKCKYKEYEFCRHSYQNEDGIIAKFECKNCGFVRNFTPQELVDFEFKAYRIIDNGLRGDYLITDKIAEWQEELLNKVYTEGDL